MFIFLYLIQINIYFIFILAIIINTGKMLTPNLQAGVWEALIFKHMHKLQEIPSLVLQQDPCFRLNNSKLFEFSLIKD